MIENRKNWIIAPAENLTMVLVVMLLLFTFSGCGSPPWWKSYGFKSYDQAARPSSVTVLIQALVDRNPRVREGAASALGEIGPPAKEAVPALIKALEDNNSGVRCEAATALGQIGAQAEVAVPALIKALGDNHSFVRGRAATALGQLGPEATVAIPSLMDVLAYDKSEGVRHHVRDAIILMGSAAKRELIQALDHKDRYARSFAARALAKLGPEAKDAVPALIKTLSEKYSDNYYFVRQRSALALGAIGPEAKAAVPALIRVLDDKHVRRTVLEALEKIGLSTKEAIPALISALADRDYKVRNKAASLLAGLGATEELYSSLTDALGNSDIYVRWGAGRAIGKLGPAASKTIPALIEGLRQNNVAVRHGSAFALGKIGSEAREAVPELIRTLGDSDTLVRSTAARSLGEIGPHAKEAAPALVLALGDGGETVRKKAFWAIGQLGSLDASAGSGLTTLLSNPEPDTRKKALSLLQQSGYTGTDFVQALEKIARTDPDNSLRKLASDMLRKMRFTALASGKPVEPKQAPTVAPPVSQTQRPVSPPIGLGQRWAVVIGISQYHDTRIPSLRYASVDAESFYEWLISLNGGKYAPSRVNLLIDRDATARNIRQALFEWLGQALEEDIVTIYFAGHGSPQSPDRPSNLFFLPYDAQYDNIASTGFPMWDIETALKRFIKANKVVVIADACHAGGVGRPFDIATRAGRGIMVNPINAGLQNLSKVGDGVCVISASDEGQLSQEGKNWGGGHGVFTYFLLQGLKAEADYNNDDTVMLGELIPYLSEKVRRATRSAQSPVVAGKFDPALTIAR